MIAVTGATGLLGSHILSRLLTHLSANLAYNSFRYNHQKSEAVLGMQFRTLEETLAWCCMDYFRNVKTNKQKMQVAVAL